VNFENRAEYLPFGGDTLPLTCADGNHGNIFDIGYDFHLSNGNNGNVLALTNFKDATRNQSFVYDSVNRLTSAQNAGTDCNVLILQNKTKFWGNTYSYDDWGNLYSKTITKCGAESLSVIPLANNQLSGYGYGAAGNMTNDLTDHVTPTYDQENRLTGANGYAYIYDADGNRVHKSNGSTGTLYWYMTPGIVGESDLSGNLTDEYIFFDGERVARKSTNGVFYYFSDHLKTASVITDAAGIIKSESDFYPWGGELQFVNNDSNHYKFTGKERDSETQLDYFGARYYSNGLGRWISADWSATPVPVPYADFGDPQSLNLYGYVRDIPTTGIDADGHQLTVDPQLQSTVDTLRQQSPLFDSEMAAHEGPGAPDLNITVGNTPNDPNGSPSTGNTTSQITPTIETITSDDPNPDHYCCYKGATVTINKSVAKDDREGVLKHEVGHVHDDRNNTNQAGRDAQHTKETHGKTPHDDRPEEKRANKFKDDVTKEQKESRKQQKEKKHEDKKHKENK
jgi:RHS repeat-associated protein